MAAVLTIDRHYLEQFTIGKAIQHLRQALHHHIPLLSLTLHHILLNSTIIYFKTPIVAIAITIINLLAASHSHQFMSSFWITSTFSAGPPTLPTFQPYPSNATHTSLSFLTW